jgi:NADH dehydrogenase (ubiquinone) Fe-S protein 6
MNRLTKSINQFKSFYTIRNYSSALDKVSSEKKYVTKCEETVTHTGQIYDVDDYRRVRFNDVNKKIVNKNIAMELVAKDPIVVSDKNVVCSSAGGALGHPKIYINLDRNEVHDCGYSGRRFILRKYYDEAKHGKSIDYNTFLEQLKEE